MPVDNSNEPSCQQQETRDPIIVLDVGGHRPFFESHRSTLTLGSSYFASRFRDNSNSNNNRIGTMQPGGFLGQDEFGRGIYFVDRDGDLFRYVLEFLRNNTVDLPNYYDAENQPLWRSLRREAAFYGVQGLSDLLQVTYSCEFSPDLCGRDKGILYWLGTNRGQSSTYRNPYTIGAVNVHVEENGFEQEGDDLIPQRLYEEYGRLTWSEFRKASFVQHRQKVNATGNSIQVGAALSLCGGDVGSHVVVDLRSIRVRATHYSIRYGDCDGMTSDWEFAGSIDGNQWDVLHEAKDESYIDEPGEGTIQDMRERFGLDRQYRPNIQLSAFQREQMTHWVETNCRRTWSIPNSQLNGFYSLFRIQKVEVHGCLHGTSFEIFGDVNE